MFIILKTDNFELQWFLFLSDLRISTLEESI